MKISDMKRVIKENFLNQKTPLFFHGSPGIGKTEGVEQAHKELEKELKRKIHLRTIILSQYESVDLRGLPKVVEEMTRWCGPEELTYKEDDEVIIFFDELPNAAQDVQKAAQQLIHTGRIGTLVMPKNTLFIAAGNRQGDKAGANRILSALANRFEHHDVEACEKDWINNWAIPRGIDHSIIAFISWKPLAFNTFDANRRENATPRTWVKVHDLMGSNMFDERVLGTVGKGEGSEFLAHRKIWNILPSAEAIWKDPSKVEMPKEASIQYATAMNLALKATTENFSNALTFMKKAGKEMQIVYIQYACSTQNKVRSLKEFQAYLKENKGIIFE